MSPVYAPSISLQPPALNAEIVTSGSIGRELRQCRARFLEACSAGSTPVHVVLGNESADLDSVVSAISLALMRTRASGDFYVPLLNLPQQDLPLRRDVLATLAVAGISQQDLLFVDQLPNLAQLASVGRLAVHLVDHNELALEQTFLAPHVVEIIDHHAQGSIRYPSLAASRDLRERCASTASLIARELLPHYAELPPEIVRLLIAAILIDSRNLASQGPATELDRSVLDSLAKAAAPIDLEQLHAQLTALRNDVTGLTWEQVLRRDIKYYGHSEARYAISTLPAQIDWHEQQDAALNHQLAEFSQLRSLELHFCLIVGGPTSRDARTIKIYHETDGRAENIADQLMRHAELGVELSRGPNTSTIATLYCARMIPRKELQPLLSDLSL